MPAFEDIKNWFADHSLVGEILILVGVVIGSYFAFKVTNRLIVSVFKKIAIKSKTKFDDAIFESPLLTRLSYIVPILIIDKLAFLIPSAEQVITTGCHLLLIWVVLRSISAFLEALNNYYETLPISKERPIKGYIQVSTIILYIFGIIFMIGLLTEKSPWVLMSGVGALTALILLIFRDTILSFVAGIQITRYNLVRVGDWIEMPKYGANGDVIDIALHTVQVQNWDKTIVSIPTHKLTEDSFKNWRGMIQAGGRRIKRAVYVDQNSIKFSDEEMIKRFKKIHLLTDYIQRKKEELDKYNREHNFDENVLVNGRRMTNVGTFRAYIEAYIKNHPKVNHNLTTMVRQLPPGPNGLPIEIYLFTNDIVWQNYEAIQADIFDHLLSVVPEFDLRIFQNPSGRDFSALGKQ